MNTFESTFPKSSGFCSASMSRGLGISILNSSPRIFSYLLMPFQVPCQLDIQSRDPLPLPHLKASQGRATREHLRFTHPTSHRLHKTTKHIKTKKLKHCQIKFLWKFPYFGNIFFGGHSQHLQHWSERILFVCRSAKGKRRKMKKSLYRCILIYFFPWGTKI